MRDDFAGEVAEQGDDAAIVEILHEVCRVTGMGFAAVARVTETRWIAAQVEDRIEFGLNPGDELEIKKTICDDIRRDGRAIVIDHIGADPDWRTHPVPALYGFESYASLPVVLADGSFYGTLCAIDPAPRLLSAHETMAALQVLADRVSAILSRKILGDS
ncbi:GAF domain-containing protein [Sphingosinicella sp. LHD-64]|uniref:GAF domain-containing protein n=1 Tax=Sphingosinicella sp. LHD-64 TaxID=3072139 RepID=UPI00280D5DD9|nr:GAF domain-containing protein [Sphingosinicella sp. LHD-64]MDQ8754633.1 GAF domain-containing protein [Sphingosinicella sp. LHD-64]